MKITLTFLLKAPSQRRLSGGKFKDYFFLVGFSFPLFFFLFARHPTAEQEGCSILSDSFLQIPWAEIFQVVCLALSREVSAQSVRLELELSLF